MDADVYPSVLVKVTPLQTATHAVVFIPRVRSFSVVLEMNSNYVAADDGAKGIVEMLFCTSLIALVGAADHPHSSPRKLQIVNTKVRRVM